jgi:sigma-B regulation protein RsbU (phosphoserine phosphatase)
MIMALLRYIDEQGHLKTKTLLADPVVIGRAPTCQLVLPSDMLSREHARIELVSDGRYSVRDLGARNKTYVCGQLVSETLLNPGDIIRLGDRVIEFLDEGGHREKIDLDFLTPDDREPPDCGWIKIRAPLTLNVKQVEKLACLTGHLAMTSRPEDFADAVLSGALLDFGAERGFVALRGESKRELRVIAHRSLTKPKGGSLTPVSESFVMAALLQSVAGRYPESTGKVDLKSGYAATAMVAPLTFRGEVVGVIYVDRPASNRTFPAASEHMMAAVGAHLGAVMAESSRRLVDSATREGAAWMSTLRRLQAAMAVPVASSETFDVGTKTFPGRARCGDVCDVLHLDPQRCAAVTVDAGGHGLTGLAQASAICTAVRSTLAVSDDALMDPALMFGAINEAIASSPTRQVVPCTYIGIDLATGKVAYINAGGMPPLLMVGQGRLITLDHPSLVLGVDPDYTYEVTRVDLPDHFRLISYTDGLVEATNTAGEALGHQRLHDALLDREAFRDLDHVLQTVKDVWDTHLSGSEPDDDASLLVISRG